MRFAHQEDKVNSTLNKISLFLLDKASAINTLIALCKVPITLPWQTSFFFFYGERRKPLKEKMITLATVLRRLRFGWTLFTAAPKNILNQTRAA